MTTSPAMPQNLASLLNARHNRRSGTGFQVGGQLPSYLSQALGNSRAREEHGRTSVDLVTTGKHLEHIFEKLGVRSRTAALAKLRAGRLPAPV
jgi:hypothetical protein